MPAELMSGSRGRDGRGVVLPKAASGPNAVPPRGANDPATARASSSNTYAVVQPSHDVLGIPGGDSLGVRQHPDSSGSNFQSLRGPGSTAPLGRPDSFARNSAPLVVPQGSFAAAGEREVGSQNALHLTPKKVHSPVKPGAKVKH